MNTSTYALTVLLLLSPLGSDHFRVREKAHAWFAEHLDEAAPVLFAGECSPDPEIACRCRMLTDAWTYRHVDELVARTKPINWEAMPWLDYLDPGDDEDVTWCLCAAGWQDWMDPTCDESSEAHIAATSLWVRLLILRRRDPQSIRSSLRRLCHHHRDWCGECGLEVPPEPIFLDGRK